MLVSAERPSNVGREAILPWRLPRRRPCNLQDVCALVSIGDIDKERCRFAVLLTAQHHKRVKTKYERYVDVIDMRAMSGCTGNDFIKTHRYATRNKPGTEKWMSALSHNTSMTILDSIFTTGLVLGGMRKTPYDVQLSPTCSFSVPIC